MKNKFLKIFVCRSMIAAAVLCTMCCFGSSCGSDAADEIVVKMPDAPAPVWVKLDKTLHRMPVGSTVAIVPAFSSEEVSALPFGWSSSDPSVATVVPASDGSAVVTALSVGTTIVEIACADRPMLAAQCVLTVRPETPDDGVVRILAIGNSFSEDAVEQYLWNLADAEGIETVIGNMYIPGCSLETHVENATGDKAAYSYRKVVGGTRTVTANVRLSAAIADEEWDYISLQQVSGYSGVYSRFEQALPALAEYVRARATDPKMKLILHQTWAYAATSGHNDFAKYDRNQTTMYRAIVDAYERAAVLVGADRVVPSGTAVQNGRTSYLGDTFCRDGYHLEKNFGRYTAACTWFETIFGRDATGCAYKPESVSLHEAEVARAAAHRAVLTPGAVTELTEYAQDPELGEMPYGVYVDFGSALSPAPWNNLASVDFTDAVDLKDSKGAATGMRMRATKPFGGVNTNGPAATATSLPMPATASSDSFWGNTGAAFQGKVTGPTELTFDGLDPRKSYVFTFFSSREKCTDNRSAQFTVSGAASEVLLLDGANNTDKTVSSGAAAPDAEGRIVVTITSGPQNNNKNGFYYINAMCIAPAR